MRTRGNERVSVRQGYGYGCRYGTLNEANLLKTARTCCSLEAWSANFRPFVHDLNTSRPNRQVRSASGTVGGILVHCVTGQAVLVDLYTTLPVDFLGRMQCWWLFGFGKDYTSGGVLDIYSSLSLLYYTFLLHAVNIDYINVQMYASNT
jgi:hypothetical protein